MPTDTKIRPDHLRRRAVGELANGRGADLERHTDLLQDRATLRRGGREEQRRRRVNVYVWAEALHNPSYWNIYGTGPAAPSIATIYSDVQAHTRSRISAPVVRATVAIGTIVALVASVGAPFKWY